MVKTEGRLSHSSLKKDPSSLWQEGKWEAGEAATRGPAKARQEGRRGGPGLTQGGGRRHRAQEARGILGDQPREVKAGLS